jgi:hypothetical protein
MYEYTNSNIYVQQEGGWSTPEPTDARSADARSDLQPRAAEYDAG